MKWRRILIWCGIAFGAIAIYAWFFGIATMFVVEARWLGWQHPALGKTPVELHDVSASRSPGRRVSYLGYRFEVPRDDLDEQRTRAVGSWQVIAFSSGREIVFCAFPPGQFLDGLFPKSKIDRRGLENLFGADDMRSDYDFVRDMLATTPATLKVTTSRTEAVRGLMRLTYKFLTGSDSDSGIFRIDAESFRGFQYGDPSSEQLEIRDDLFSTQGRAEFRFVRPKNGPKFSQAEINRVIQSLRVAQ